MDNMRLSRLHRVFRLFDKPTKSESTMKLSKAIVATLFVSALMFTLSACDKQGPLEKAGEKIDDKVEDTGDAIEDATDSH